MPPEFPEEKSKSISSSGFVSFSPNVPVVKSISGYELQKLGWKHIEGNRYKKGDITIRYDGTHWLIGDRRYDNIEDLPE